LLDALAGDLQEEKRLDDNEFTSYELAKRFPKLTHAQIMRYVNSKVVSGAFVFVRVGSPHGRKCNIYRVAE
jgi:hypothetical protein